jgi:hypothetical protein
MLMVNGGKFRVVAISLWTFMGQGELATSDKQFLSAF